MDHLKPEAACFGPLAGKRTGIMVFDMQDGSEPPPTGEPFSRS
ncbi:hypothetical protein [Streptomyces sp. SCL15-6]|nr:hypothetical protein [Streptomyces sp. SCL15-6]